MKSCTWTQVSWDDTTGKYDQCTSIIIMLIISDAHVNLLNINNFLLTLSLKLVSSLNISLSRVQEDMKNTYQCNTVQISFLHHCYYSNKQRYSVILILLIYSNEVMLVLHMVNEGYTVDIKRLHFPVKRAGFCDVFKKN